MYFTKCYLPQESPNQEGVKTRGAGSVDHLQEVLEYSQSNATTQARARAFVAFLIA